MPHLAASLCLEPSGSGSKGCDWSPRPGLQVPSFSLFQGSVQGPSLDTCRCHAQPGQRPSLPPEPIAVGGRVPPSQVSGFLGLLHPPRPAKMERVWDTALPVSGSSWSCFSKVRPSPSPQWTRGGETLPWTLPGLCPPQAGHLPSAWCPQGVGCAEGLRTRLAAAHPAL